MPGPSIGTSVKFNIKVRTVVTDGMVPFGGRLKYFDIVTILFHGHLKSPSV